MGRAARLWMAAIVAAAMTTVIGLVELSPMMWLLQEKLHGGCSLIAEGEGAGSFVCADGIGYVLPILFVAMSQGAIFLTAFVIIALSDPARGTRTMRILTLLSLLPLVLMLSTSLLAARSRTAVAEQRPDYWTPVMAIPAALIAFAALVLLVAVVWQVPRIALVSRGLAAALLIGATFVEVGVLYGTLPALVILGMAGLIDPSKAAVNHTSARTEVSGSPGPWRPRMPVLGAGAAVAR